MRMFSQALVLASLISACRHCLRLSIVGLRPCRLLEFLQPFFQRLHGRAAGDITARKYPAAVLRTQWVPYERISPNLKRAIIAAEDSKFLEHEGFDFDAIQKAYRKT